MAVEKKEDQTQEKAETQGKAPEQPQKEEKSEERTLPEKEPFKGDKMLEHLEQIEAEEALSKPKEEEKKEAEKPTPETKTKKQAEETKPFKVLKRKGEEIAVQTEEEYDKLASQGLDYTSKRQADSEDRRNYEKDRDEKESKIIQTGDAINRLVEGIEQGRYKIVPTGELEPEQDDLEDLDPEVRGIIEKDREKIKALEGALGRLDEKSKVGDEERGKANFVRARDELDALHETVREEIPYDMIKDGERNLSKDLFTSLCTQKVNEDRIKASQDKNFKPRNFKELFKATAKDLQAIRKHYKGESSGTEDGSTITLDVLKEKYPELIAELGEAAVEKHLEEQDLTAPSIRSTTREAKETKKVGKITGLADAIDQAFEDPEVVDASAQFSKKNYGLKND